MAVGDRAPAVPIHLPTAGETQKKKSKAGRGCIPSVVASALVLFVFVSPKTCATIAISGEATTALDAVRKCPRAMDLLGSDVAPAWVGCATGKSKSGCDSGSGHWRLPITGSRESGTLGIAASKSKSGWKATMVILEVGNTRIDVMECKDLPPDPDD